MRERSPVGFYPETIQSSKSNERESLKQTITTTPWTTTLSMINESFAVISFPSLPSWPILGILRAPNDFVTHKVENYPKEVAKGKPVIKNILAPTK